MKGKLENKTSFYRVATLWTQRPVSRRSQRRSNEAIQKSSFKEKRGTKTTTESVRTRENTPTTGW